MNIGWIFGFDFNIPIWIVIPLVLVVAIYIHSSWHFGVFKKLSIPGPKPVPIFGTMGDVMKKGITECDTELMEKYGDIVGTFQGRKPTLMVKDLEIIKQVLVKNFNNFINKLDFTMSGDPVVSNMLSIISDDHWRNTRAFLSPTFSSGKLKHMQIHIMECSKQFVNNLRQDTKNGAVITIEEYTRAYTMDIIASTAFGLQIDSQKDRNNQFVRMGNRAMDFSFKNPMIIIFFFLPFLSNIISKLGATLFPRDSMEFFRNVINQVIQNRKESSEKRTDFVQLMLNTHKYDEKGGETSNQNGDPSLQKQNKKKGMTDDEILANAFLFFVAGFDTTANTLSFVFYLLAINPKEQQRLFEEVDTVLQGKEPTYDDVNKMPFLQQVLDETLRLYPLAPRLERIAAEAVTINGVHIPKQMKVGIPVASLHRDERYWNEPDKFNPDRFTPEEKANRNPYCYLPFSLGPRNCIGMRLALLELKIVIIKMVQNFEIKQCAETQVPLKLQKVRVSSESGIKLQLCDRKIQ